MIAEAANPFIISALIVMASITGYLFVVLWPKYLHHNHLIYAKNLLNQPAPSSLQSITTLICIHASFRYWLAFLATLLLTLTPAFSSPNWPQDGYYLIIIMTALVISAAIDYRHQVIPDECNAAIIITTFMYHLGDPHLNSSVIGLIVGYLLIYTCRLIWLVINSVEAIGLGDAKLLAALGAWQGPEALTNILLYASLLGILYSLLLRLRNKKTKRKIAFGPFLIAAGILIFYGF